jgi:hypothetical protein
VKERVPPRLPIAGQAGHWAACWLYSPGTGATSEAATR